MRVFTACLMTIAFALALLVGTAAAGGGTGGTAPPQAEPEPPSAGSPPASDLEFSAPRTAFVRDRVRVRGTSRRARNRIVRIDARRSGGAWTTVARARASRTGEFVTVWRPRATGSYGLRARAGRPSSNSDDTGGTAVPLEVGPGGAGSSARLTVYEAAIATWYGPGFFGRRTACGIELAETTVGVAHRKLPCGTDVRILYRGRTIVVPVIDRGPFANNADWDLTQAAARQLGMTGTGRIGAMPLTPER